MSTTAAPARKKGFPIVLVLVPVAVVAALVLAFSLPATHALLLKSPLAPLLAKLGLAASATPGGAKAVAADPSVQIKRLNDELESDRKAQAQKDARISALQTQVTQLQAVPSPPAVERPATTPKPSPTAVPAAVKNTAAYWAGMDPDKAAEIAKHLPDSYVKAVFSQMPPDAVAEIMNVMPPKVAAKITADGGADPP